MKCGVNKITTKIQYPLKCPFKVMSFILQSLWDTCINFISGGEIHGKYCTDTQINNKSSIIKLPVAIIYKDSACFLINGLGFKLAKTFFYLQESFGEDFCLFHCPHGSHFVQMLHFAI